VYLIKVKKRKNIIPQKKEQNIMNKRKRNLVMTMTLILIKIYIQERMVLSVQKYLILMKKIHLFLIMKMTFNKNNKKNKKIKRNKNGKINKIKKEKIKRNYILHLIKEKSLKENPKN
jgi:hypothetical protein